MSTTVQKYIFTDSFKTTLLTCVETWTFLLRSWVRVDWSSCYCSMTAGFAANFDTTWQFWTSLISVAQLQCNRHRNIDTVHHCCHFIYEYESDNRSSCMTVSYRCMSLSNSRTVSDFRCRWSCHRTETDADGLENNFKTTPYFASPDSILLARTLFKHPPTASYSTASYIVSDCNATKTQTDDLRTIFTSKRDMLLNPFWTWPTTWHDSNQSPTGSHKCWHLF